MWQTSCERSLFLYNSTGENLPHNPKMAYSFPNKINAIQEPVCIMKAISTLPFKLEIDRINRIYISPE